MSDARRKIMRLTDFEIGQPVECLDVEIFLQPLRSYLSGRQGSVVKVYPASRPDEFYCGPINQVRILWGKRNGRGKEKEITMHPRDLKIIGIGETVLVPKELVK